MAKYAKKVHIRAKDREPKFGFPITLCGIPIMDEGHITDLFAFATCQQCKRSWEWGEKPRKNSK